MRDAQSLIAQLNLGLDSVVRKAIKTGNEIMEESDSPIIPSNRGKENKPPNSQRWTGSESATGTEKTSRAGAAALRREEERKRAVSSTKQASKRGATLGRETACRR